MVKALGKNTLKSRMMSPYCVEMPVKIAPLMKYSWAGCEDLLAIPQFPDFNELLSYIYKVFRYHQIFAIKRLRLWSVNRLSKISERFSPSCQTEVNWRHFGGASVEVCSLYRRSA